MFLDWSSTNTTLSVYNWLKFEDIASELYMNKCRIVRDIRDERKEGEKQPGW